MTTNDEIIEEEHGDATSVAMLLPLKEYNYPSKTYFIVSRMAYLTGVPKVFFERSSLDIEQYKELEAIKDARIIRNLCMIRNGIEQNYRRIYVAFRNDIKNLHTLPEYINADAIEQLYNDGIDIIKANYPLEKYVIDINKLIASRINTCQSLIPIWVNWAYIRKMFIMPNGTKPEGVKAATNEYNSSKYDYPYQIYINWKGKGNGNIFYNDGKFITLLYEENNDRFADLSKVKDAGNLTKNSIYDFLKRSAKTCFVVDCENSDPYKMYAMLNNLNQNELLTKISKIILFDDVHTSSAWDVLADFTDIPVEHIMLERVKHDKSFLDIRLSVGVCKEFYQFGVQSFILVSSDSDYWGLIPTLQDANFLVMVEESKVSDAIRNAMEENKIMYCYLDDFCTGNSSKIKEWALLKDINSRLEAEVNFNINAILNEAYTATRAGMTKDEKEQFYNRYIKHIHLSINEEGEVYARVGDTY